MGSESFSLVNYNTRKWEVTVNFSVLKTIHIVKPHFVKEGREEGFLTTVTSGSLPCSQKLSTVYCAPVCWALLGCMFPRLCFTCRQMPTQLQNSYLEASSLWAQSPSPEELGAIGREPTMKCLITVAQSR